MILALNKILGGRVHPADVERVDADAMAHDRIGRVPRQRHQGALRRGVRREHGDAAVGGHTADVDDGARDPLAPHNLDRLLDQDEGRADVDGHDPIPQLGRGVPDRPAIGDAGGVDEDINLAELLVGGGDDAAAILDAGQIGLHKVNAAGGRVECGGDGVAAFRVSSANDQPGNATLCEQARNRFAQALGAARHNRNLASQRRSLSHCRS